MFDLCSTQILYLYFIDTENMASIKVILRSKTNKKGEHPLVMQVIKDRKKNIVSLGYNLKKEDWDAVACKVKRSHPNHVRLNNLILKKLSEAHDTLIDLETNKKDTTAKAIKNTIVADKEGTFLKQAHIYLDNLKRSGKYNRHNNDSPKIERVKEFAGGDIAFSDITVPFLRNFQAWMKGTRQIKERTVVNHLVIIRSIYNQAIQAGVADQKNYPFGKGKISIKFPDSKKVGMTKEEIALLEAVNLPNVGQHHARNIYLVSYYFAGMRVSDVLRLKWADFQNGRLYYTMGKNSKTDSLKVPEKALTIIDQYRDDTPHYDLVFPYLKSLSNLKDEFEVQKYIKVKVRSINTYLKTIATDLKITKKLTMHVSRHSFAQVSADKIPVQILQKLYRHTSITTTIGYQSNFSTKDMDDALESVIEN